MVALADDRTVAHDQRAHGRIGRGAAHAATGELVGALQVELVERRQPSIGGSHGAAVFVTATTTASSTVPPARRTASAQSRSVAPVVQTSSSKSTRRDATGRGVAGEASAGRQPRGARPAALRVAATLLQRGRNVRTRQSGGDARDQRHAVEAPDAPPAHGRRNGHDRAARRNEACRDATERLADVAPPVLERKHRRPQRTFIRAAGRHAQRGQRNADRFAARRASVAESAAERVAANALRGKHDVEQGAPGHRLQSRRRPAPARPAPISSQPASRVRSSARRAGSARDRYTARCPAGR